MPVRRLILPHGLNFATWTSSFKNTHGAASLFPPWDIPLCAVNKSKATTAYFSRWGPVSRTNEQDSVCTALHNVHCSRRGAEAQTRRLPLCTGGWKGLAAGNSDSNSRCNKNYHFCVLSVTDSALDFPLLFNPFDSRARSHKNSFQCLHHRNSPKP